MHCVRDTLSSDCACNMESITSGECDNDSSSDEYIRRPKQRVLKACKTDSNEVKPEDRRNVL